jgi:hypothetical protein
MVYALHTYEPGSFGGRLRSKLALPENSSNLAAMKLLAEEFPRLKLAQSMLRGVKSFWRKTCIVE